MTNTIKCEKCQEEYMEGTEHVCSTQPEEKKSEVPQEKPETPPEGETSN